MGFGIFCSIIIAKMTLKKLLTVPALILGLLIVVQLSRSIISIYGRGGRVGELAAEVAGLEKEKEDLEREKAFRETAEFVEREARDKLRMVREGERILVLPDETRMSADRQADERGTVVDVQSLPNWKRWVEFWFD